MRGFHFPKDFRVIAIAAVLVAMTSLELRRSSLFSVPPVRSVRIDGARMLNRTKAMEVPAYPARSLVNRVEGRAVVALLIGVDGRVETANVLESPDALTAAALNDAARTWTFVEFAPAGRSPARVSTTLVFYWDLASHRLLNATERARLVHRN